MQIVGKFLVFHQFLTTNTPITLDLKKLRLWCNTFFCSVCLFFAIFAWPKNLVTFVMRGLSRHWVLLAMSQKLKLKLVSQTAVLQIQLFCKISYLNKHEKSENVVYVCLDILDINFNFRFRLAKNWLWARLSSYWKLSYQRTHFST